MDQVFKGHNRRTGKVFAIKVIKPGEDGNAIPPPARREIKYLQKLRHPNIITLHNVVHASPEPPLLVLEYMEYDLKKFSENTGLMDYLTIKSFMYQLLEGLAYCHENRVMHRNVNPFSIYINRHGILKLSGFSRARDLSAPPTRTNICFGHPWYRAPELILGYRNYGIAIDVWAAGCVMFEMYMRCPLFGGDHEIVHLDKIFQLIGTPTEETWPGISQCADQPEFKQLFHSPLPRQDIRATISAIDNVAFDLFLRLLQLNPDSRIGARGALAHPWFDDLTEQTRRRTETHMHLYHAEIAISQARAQAEEQEKEG